MTKPKPKPDTPPEVEVVATVSPDDAIQREHAAVVKREEVASTLASVGTSNAAALVAAAEAVADRLERATIRDDSARSWSLFCDTGGVMSFGAGPGGCGTGSAAFIAGQWWHVAFTRVGADSYVYVNGKQVATTNNGQFWSSSAATVCFGSNPSGGGSNPNCVYGSLRFSTTRSLTSANVLAIYNEQRTGSRGLYNWVDLPSLSTQAAGGAAFKTPWITRSRILGGGIL